ncbi:MAG: KTSC domain-containing protein [Anaerolineae bacterium]|nr:KTSC domain-containing protein [Anaerolineae bacterium]
MNREPVTSSFIKSIGWEETLMLEIEFSNGDVWQYHGVPPDMWEGFRIAESHGEFFHTYIKDQFPANRATAASALPSVGPGGG